MFLAGKRRSRTQNVSDPKTMANPSTLLRSTRWQIVFLAAVAMAVTTSAFQAGRQTVDAAVAAKSDAPVTATPSADPVSQKKMLLAHDNSRITVREIATVPFSELYDVLKAAPPEQLLAWGRDLEQMREGPRRTAAIRTFYKSLVQIDPAIARAAVAQIKEKWIQQEAATALLATAPESIWGDLAEFFETVPFPRDSWENPIRNWSRVDPVAVSHFIENHPKKLAKDELDDDRVITLLAEWAEIDPSAAKEWLDADPNRQTEEARSTWVMGFAEHDRPAAASFLIRHASEENFAEAIRRFSYGLFLDARDQMMSFVFQLPPEQARMTVQNVAETTSGFYLHASEGFQRPPAEVANWLVTLPTDFWTGAMGKVIGTWLLFDAPPAIRWVEQMAPRERDIALADLCRAPEEHQFGGRPEEVVAKIVQLGLKISDPKVRDESLAAVLPHLAYTDEDRQAAIEGLPVTKEEKQYLRRLPPRDDQH
ncbi:MAG: hypothetical protein ABR611_14835 [Chthoniobacterales bacterium]